MRDYPKEYAKDYLEKSKRFLGIAKENIGKYPQEAAFNAIQANINANDAFTIWILEKRASKDHREAILLHKEAAAKIGESKSEVIHIQIDSRDAAGYDVKKNLSKGECEIIIKKAERFISWVEYVMKRYA